MNKSLLIFILLNILAISLNFVECGYNRGGGGFDSSSGGSEWSQSSGGG
nr:unnamed protein product [Meloidogyne enterolobii]